jgi:hypothetical protein
LAIIKYTYIFATIKFTDMFEFHQYLGFLMFLAILTIGFWLMIFLIGFVHYWAGGAIMELIKEIKEKKQAEKEALK